MTGYQVFSSQQGRGQTAYWQAVLEIELDGCVRRGVMGHGLEGPSWRTDITVGEAMQSDIIGPCCWGLENGKEMFVRFDMLDPSVQAALIAALAGASVGQKRAA